ncbi:hypothetical protein LOAG_16923 [Loa loa]|uniref:Uncharacterized protein n=1 Tax=Loa loa TaxID=7209 RepID=A0A1S0UKH6_LOALO|nr:hypothetical protein LOAG_16923 [Loa loa]EJD76033.1 hypothetical protein LOAG_16923 [Loa loa]
MKDQRTLTSQSFDLRTVEGKRDRFLPWFREQKKHAEGTPDVQIGYIREDDA